MQTIARITGLALVLIATAVRAGPRMERDDLPDPRPEIARHVPIVVLPAVPGFELPPVEPGFHGPRELRVRGSGLLGTEIKVKGYVTSIYDCASVLALSRPQATRAELEISVDGDPTQCERPKFTLGDSARAPREVSISVVDVPRPPARPEREALSPEELALWPAVPRIATGDYLIVTGTWATRSPHDEQNTGGLLIYKALEPAVPTAPIASAEPDPAAPASTEAHGPAVAARPRLRKVVDLTLYNESVDHLNACNKRIVAEQYNAGIAACAMAVALWDGNHLAWYALASAHLAKSQWFEAWAAMQRAVALRADQAMYQLYLGIALYELVRDRDGRLRRGQDEPAAGRQQPTLEAARDALLYATRLDPDLWRAHYYLGRVYRDLADARPAAEQLTQTIALHPTYRPAYIALSELYRRWDYPDQALAVALLGTQHVRYDAELWYEAGMAYDAKRADDEAIAAFGKAINGTFQDTRAKFQRSQVYLRKRKLAEARRDLEDVVRAGGRYLSDLTPIAVQLLAQLER